MIAEQRHTQLMQRLAEEPSTPLDSIVNGLMVISTPRSGSTMFCDTLSQTGKIGLCEEWFHYDYIRAYLQLMGKTDINMPEYLRFVSSKTVKDTGVFAIHAHVNQLMLIDEVFGVRLSDMTFTHVCYVYRSDLLAQAVSLALSQVTGKWRHDELPTSAEKPSMQDCEAARKDLIACFQAYRDVYKRQVNAEYNYEEFTLPGHVRSFNEVLTALGKEPQQEFSTVIKRSQPNPLLDQYIQYRIN